MSLLRVLHVCAQGDGLAWTLSRRERALGMVSDVMRLYGDDEQADIDLGTHGRGPRDIAARTQAGLKAALDYDVLHFHDCSLFSWDDLDGHEPSPLLDVQSAKALGRRIVFTLSGAEGLRRLEPCLPLADAIFYLDPGLGPRLEQGVLLGDAERDPARMAEVVIGAYQGLNTHG
jgi:hypothetical protein